MNPKLRDVAEHAGVSVRTVSNVVNGFRYVAPATRERVQASIDALGYRPNLAARTLRQGRTGLVALVIPEIDSPYFSELAARTVRIADARGLTVLIDQTDGDAERETRLLHGRRSQLVDGVLFSPWAVTPAELASRTDTAPLVLLGEHDGTSGVDHVAIDNVAAAREATAHLLARGRRRIAAVGNQPRSLNATARQRLAGYREALADAGLPAEPELEVTVPSLHRADGHQAMLRLLDSPRPPDAVFCFTDELALGALRAAADRGVAVPDSLALIGFDDIEDGRFSVPALTTVSPDKDRIAELALDRLAEQMSSPRSPRSIVAPHRLVVRETS
ncbi:LacI family DNA-binding transcriptional regulator [Amycolatopsis roodepoortensis]|uniref:DNA-binding LacI/PurR family transcriptional regulator n=1 Tax=Amycolatopsis roodepoortensis TaxID=700274 RepID=A0ABR9L0X7_9PSEU|nr:LacI family DNA-binding transcriptional regulator [Amycolatopsis roodepoortensis]MBE1574261.1 DNA-binding LacI/PurR family transcriptional regulator [Amycolatopsis roodepoortensis]